MPNCRVHVSQTFIVGLLLLSALGMQGCVAIVWLAAVWIDRARTSDIEFQPFENSWVGGPQERQHLASIKRIAVMPFDGDPMMAERWTVVFRNMTDLRVENRSDATGYGASDYGPIRPAQRMSVESQVDCVLIGHVTGQVPKKSFIELKERSSLRLHLQMVSDSGILLWKTELPYTMIMGAKGLDEEMATKALLTHVRAHANELGFGELVPFNKRTASRSLPHESDHHMARLVRGGERP
jgi:hypothetical protein